MGSSLIDARPTYRLSQFHFLAMAALLTPIQTATAQTATPPWTTWNDTTLSDTVRLKAIDEWNWKRFVRERPDTAVILARTQLAFARLKGQRYWEARAHTILGVVAKQMGQHSQALDHHTKALAMARALKSAEGISRELINIAVVKLATGELASAMSDLSAAVQAAESSGDRRSLASALLNIGSVFNKQGDAKTALGYYIRAIDVNRALSDTAQLARALSIAGGLTFENGDQLRAVSMMEESMRLNEASGNDYGLMESMVNLGVLRLRTGNAQGAMALFQRTLRSAREMDDLEGQLVALSSMADASLNTIVNDPAAALRYANEALPIAKRLGNLEWTAEVTKTLYTVHRRSGHYQEALVMYEAYMTLHDSLTDIGSQRSTIRQDMEFGFRKQALADSLELVRRADEERFTFDSRLQHEEDRREFLIIFGIVGAFALLVFAYLLWKRLQQARRLSVQDNLLHAQKVDELMHTQEIGAINAMLEGQEKERDRLAKDLHDRLGSMLSAIKHQLGAVEEEVHLVRQDQSAQYNKVHSMLDDAVGEVRRISHDMITVTLSRFGLEKALEDLCDTVRVTGRLAVELRLFGLEHRMERSMEIAVYRIVQESISNVLKHAQATELSVDVTREPGRLSVIVHDDGKGFDTSVPATGIGLENVKSRAAAIGATLRVESAIGKGTNVSVEGPVVE